MNRKKLLIGFLIFLVSIIAIDFVAGSVLKKAFYGVKKGANSVATYAIDSSKEDIVFFGSSRCANHYNPEVISQVLNMPCLNAGRSGQMIPYPYPVFKAMAARHAPKIIGLEVYFPDLTKNDVSYEKTVSSLLPYCNDNKEIKDFICEIDPKEKVLLLSKSYPYNSKIFDLILQKDEKYKFPRNGFYEKPVKEKMEAYRFQNLVADPNVVIDEKKVEVLERFIKDCQTMNIKLYLFTSPYFYEVKDHPVINRIKSLADKYHVSYYNFINDTAFTGKGNLFFDAAHLNKNGASLYSLTVAELIKSSWQNQIAGR